MYFWKCSKGFYPGTSWMYNRSHLLLVYWKGKEQWSHHHSKIVNTVITPTGLPLLLCKHSVLPLLQEEAFERCAYNLLEAGWRLIKMILCDRYYKCLCYSSLSQILFQLVPILADHFPRGSRVFGTLWKLAVITATVAICACLIYLWRVVLAVSILQ